MWPNIVILIPRPCYNLSSLPDRGAIGAWIKNITPTETEALEIRITYEC